MTAPDSAIERTEQRATRAGGGVCLAVALALPFWAAVGAAVYVVWTVARSAAH